MKPEPKNFDHHLGQSVLRRKPNIFKLFYKYETIPNIAILSGGLPNAGLFPIDKLEAAAADPSKLQGSSVSDHQIRARSDELEAAMQYGQASGLPEMSDWFQTWTDKVFDCPYSTGFKTMVSLGSTDGWFKVLSVLSNEWHDESPLELREGLITEEFTYSLAVEAARTRGLNIAPVAMDSEGILPEALEKMLANWDPSQGKRPHLMYTVSIGQNPTGATMGAERRKAVYAICQKYDVLIVEDEPYWFLQYGKEEKCYLSIDTDGRVLRLDSFSKNFVPGARMGWITGQPALIARVFQLAEEATQQPSGFAQLVMLETLREWGHDGWMQWLTNLKGEYQNRRDIMVDVLDKYKTHDGKLILNYKRPAAGMFVWIRVQFEEHPLSSAFSNVDLGKAFWAFHATHESPVLVTPGYFFAPSLTDVEHMAPYIRLSYAPSDKASLQHETERFGKNTQQFWEITDKVIFEGLIEKFPKD